MGNVNTAQGEPIATMRIGFTGSLDVMAEQQKET
jgi:hypothetical protein